MSNNPEEENRTEAIVSSIHAFSFEAFDVAKLFVSGTDPESLKQRAGDLRARLPGIAAQMQDASSRRHTWIWNMCSEEGVALPACAWLMSSASKLLAIPLLNDHPG